MTGAHPDRPRIRVGTFGGISALPVLVAAEQGTFPSFGLDVSLSRVTGSGELLDGLLGGRFDIIHATADDLIAWRDGTDAPILAWIGGTTGPLTLAATPDVHAVADLRGRTVAVDSPINGFVSVLRRLLRDGGLGEDDVKLAAIGATRLRIEALREGRVAATMLPLPWSLIAATSGLTTLGPPDGSHALPAFGASVGPWLQTDADVSDTYLRALVSTLTMLYTDRHPEPTAAIATALSLDEHTASAIRAAVLDPRDGWSPSAYVDPTQLAAACLARAELGQVPRYEIDEYFTHEPYRRVFTSLPAA